MSLPTLPVPHVQFIPYLAKHDDIKVALEPYKTYENKLREVFAQEPASAITADPLVNVLPLFDGHEEMLKIRARDMNASVHEKDKYLLALPDAERKPSGSSAIVSSMKEFKKNFNLFSESSLVDLDWSNIVAAGSSVATSLLPVKAPHNESKRAQRQYYHEQLAPASDIDLFIYGLDEEQAVEKIRQIESKVRDSILQETTTIRTKNAITIASAYPTRHVQIVLRLYKSVSEILTGFDVDCSCVAYDGKMVWATPRAVSSYVTQINTIDLTRRSPSYENRLSKYSHRGFEVYWPELDRSKIDPTIFERSFSRVIGLARLLVLEKLPHPDDRDAYLAKRRQERGRPPLPWNARHRNQLPGNIKDSQPDDVAEWVEEDDVSNYHTFTIPYGTKYNAKIIEKLLFAKDLLLNAEWNQKERETTLHRHPAFFGSVNDVIHDCCGFCPKPTTDEDLAIAEQENKVYISGELSFIKDDPGRQTIGSFNPITDDDWTKMAYVGNTQRLCQAIVDKDVEHVQDWCEQEGVDINARDHTGRTPLQLAALCSTPEVVQCLIDHGARIVSRVADGFTALHFAAQRGNVSVINALLQKSEANREEGEQKETLKEARRDAAHASSVLASTRNEALKDEDADSQDFMEDEDSEDSDQVTDASFVKVSADVSSSSNVPDEEDADEPDVYDVDVLGWDSPLSPLHLAIIGGHVDAIKELVNNFGADVLLPVKLVDPYSKSPRAAILTLVLAAQLSDAAEVSKCLLELGASSTQADMNGASTLHYIVNQGRRDVLDLLAEYDGPAASKAVNHIVLSGWQYQPQVDTPLLTAIRGGHQSVVERLLELGARPTIAFEEFAQAYHRKWKHVSNDPEEVRKVYENNVEQPIIHAVRQELSQVVFKLIDMGANPNTLPTAAYMRLQNLGYSCGSDDDKSLLDLVGHKLKKVRDYLTRPDEDPTPPAPASLKADDEYLESLEPGSYRYWLAERDLQQAKGVMRLQMEQYRKEIEPKRRGDVKGKEEKRAAVQVLQGEYETLETLLLSKGAKTFYEIYPDLKNADDANQGNPPPYQYIKEEPYRTNQSFHVPNLTPAYEDGYFKLFEAAWNGDVKTVKELTLSEWGTHQKALQIAVQDLHGFSPLSISILRGHIDLAKTILEIANAQYQPEEGADRFRYSIQHADSDDEDLDESGDENIQVHSELVNDEFTINDIGALADRVRSSVSPMKLLTWHAEVWRFLGDDVTESNTKKIFMPGASDFSIHFGRERAQPWSWFNSLDDEESARCYWSLIRFAIATNNMKLLKFILAVGSDLAAREEDKEATKIFTVSSSDFDFAVRLGRTEMIGEIIKSTGAAIPLQKLVKTSGVEIKEKPRYYQGLSVHGRKRKDWADAGRGVVRNVVENEHPPILSVAFQGNLESLEYFLSDAPLRRYVEFAESHTDDKCIAALSKSERGIKSVLESWLGGHYCLMHLALMSKPNEDGSNPALDFLIRTLPHRIEEKDSQGNTPLQLAFQLQRYYAAKTLIAAGANQMTRNAKGENIIHTILNNFHNLKSLRGGMSLIAPDLLKPLFLEKCGEDPGSLTPLAQLIRHDRIHGKDACDIIEVLLRYSGGKDLEILDGAGDYPLHYLVRNNKTKLANIIIKYNPSLLSLENAIGQTPEDVAHNSYLRWRMQNPPIVDNSPRSYYYSGEPAGIVGRHPQEFGGREDESDDSLSDDASGMWKMCREMTADIVATHKRKLVSLFDANEVAKRVSLAKQVWAERNNARNRRRHGDSGSLIDTGEKDPVVQWLETADGYTKTDLTKFEKDFEEEETTHSVAEAQAQA